jgi:choline transport protein
MIITVMINGSLGFAMLIATLFSVGNMQKALDSPTGFPFIQIFEDATRSVGGTTAMVGHISSPHDIQLP